MKLGEKVIIAKITERCELGVNKNKTKLLSLRISKVGRNVSFAFPIKILGGENITIGNNTVIGSYCHIWGQGGVKIGNNVLIAAHCCITSLTHTYKYKTIQEGPIIKSSITIEDDVWLGYGVYILPGICIGRGSVVGAGSVVIKDIPPYSVVVGNPAQVIKKDELIILS